MTTFKPTMAISELITSELTTAISGLTTSKQIPAASQLTASELTIVASEQRLRVFGQLYLNESSDQALDF